MSSPTDVAEGVVDGGAVPLVVLGRMVVVSGIDVADRKGVLVITACACNESGVIINVFIISRK